MRKISNIIGAVLFTLMSCQNPGEQFQSIESVQHPGANESAMLSQNLEVVLGNIDLTVFSQSDKTLTAASEPKTMAAPELVNYALQRPIKAHSVFIDSSQKEYIADYASDGDETTGWASGKLEEMSWIYLDLGQEMEIEAVEILWDSKYFAKKYGVFYSGSKDINGDFNWQLLYRTSEEKGQDLVVLPAQLSKCRYIAVNCVIKNASLYGIREIRTFRKIINIKDSNLRSHLERMVGAPLFKENTSAIGGINNSTEHG